MVRWLVVAATVVALASLVSPPTATARTGEARPVVLLLHPGGFVFDFESMPYAARSARRVGFRPRFVDYPNLDLRGAVRAARAAARRARKNGHRVYAYGESAGGLLAALLAQEGLVDAASTYCPVADMVRFARQHDESYQTAIQASDRDLRRYSPVRHDSDLPILALRAARDEPYINGPIRRWERRDPELISVAVPGGHLGESDDPSVGRRNIRNGLRWLAHVAGLDSPRAEPKTALHFLK